MSKSRAKRRAESRRGTRTGESKSNRLYLILGAVVVVAIVALAYPYFSGTGSGATGPIELDGVESPEELVELARGVELGDPDAQVTIVEFADYQCPACQQFAMRVLPSVKRELVDAGLARYVFYDFPLVQMHQNAFLAARAARCAGDQDRYWEFHDELFERQSDWSRSGNPAGIFSRYAQGLGLDRATFDSCLGSDRHADVVTANQMLGDQVGVSGTPTIMVSGRGGGASRVPDWTFENIRRAVEAELER